MVGGTWIDQGGIVRQSAGAVMSKGAGCCSDQDKLQGDHEQYLSSSQI